jgi:alkylation response protein AidB-like acyl-CoA dehydrogenase
MGQELRGSVHSDQMAQKLSADPAVQAALEEMTAKAERARRTVESALSATDDRKLASWVAVASWVDEDGNVTQSILGDDHSTVLETKGLLHSAVWATAHDG